MASKQQSGSNAVSVALKKAVDWKIFELQSMLVSEEADSEVLEESVLWFQPRHYTEIVEERVNDGRCGYPLCSHHLSAAQSAAYRIDYAAKKVFSVEMSKNYCSVVCIEKAQLLEKRFDTSVPYSRHAAKKLDISKSSPSGIDDVLDLLGPSAGSKSATTSKSVQDNSRSDPPPLYTSDVLDGSGGMEVQFENGLPVPPTTTNAGFPPPVADTATWAHPTPARTSVRSVALAERSAEAEESSPVEEGTESAVPATQRQVFAPKQPSASASTQGMHTDSPDRAAAPPAKEVESAPSMAEMFAQMNALRVKHNLDKITPLPKPAVTQQGPQQTRIIPVDGNKFTSGALLHGSTQAGGSPGVKSGQPQPSAASGTAVRSGTMGRRPGPRTVKWGDTSNLAVAEQSGAAAAPAAPAAGADANIPAVPQSILKSTGVLEKPPQPVSASVKPTVSTAGKGASLQGLRHGLVVERLNPTVMSEGAMLRKREVEVNEVSSPNTSTQATKAARGNGTVAEEELVERAGRLYLDSGSAVKQKSADNGHDSDEGDHWVDVDPAELLMGGASESAAMSIEGYVAQVKSTIRVSPATTIKNLSHSPYAPRAPADGPDDQDDAVSMTEDEDHSQGDGNEVWGDEANDQEDEWPSDGEDNSPGAPAAREEGAMADGRSLFLVLWSTLDELFAGSLSGAFETGLPPYLQPQVSAHSTATAASAGAAVPMPPNATYGEVSRPPIALEEQSGQHAFLKLLQRGLSAAESQLDLMQQHIKLSEERVRYHNVKRALLSSTAGALQKRSNMQHDGGVNAGAGLESAGWTLIGMLIVDAIVIKCQLGPLGRDSSAEGTSAVVADTAGASQPRVDVAKAVWGETVEGAARAVLRNSDRRSGANGSVPRSMGRLRDGDLQILRSYFNYV
jgi:hypothetical protein